MTIASRVKIGLENARAKGKLIGRRKMRDSDLIHKRLKAGMSYRNISIAANVAEQAEAEKQMQENGVFFPEVAKANRLLT